MAVLSKEKKFSVTSLVNNNNNVITNQPSGSGINIQNSGVIMKKFKLTLGSSWGFLQRLSNTKKFISNLKKLARINLFEKLEGQHFSLINDFSFFSEKQSMVD